MKKILNVIICLALLTSVTDSCFGQVEKLLNSNTIFATGEISQLPDTIFLLQHEDQLINYQNYTKLERTHGNHFRMWFWKMDIGGIVDPAINKHELSLSTRKTHVVLRIAHDKKKYDAFEIPEKSGLKILLVKRNGKHK